MTDLRIDYERLVAMAEEVERRATFNNDDPNRYYILIHEQGFATIRKTKWSPGEADTFAWAYSAYGLDGS